MSQIYKTYLFSVCFLLLIHSFSVTAQIKKDTANFYFKIGEKASKHKVTQWFYDAVFDDNPMSDSDGPAIVLKKKTKNPFLKYKGKVVRHIDVIVLDPFGYSVNDFFGKNPDKLERLGNKYHITTKEIIIKNLLLFKADKELDPLELSESERILRLSPYIFDARIYVQKTIATKTDSVDVLVVVQDRWTITAASGFDLNAPDILLYDKNIIGFGNQYTQGFAWNATDKYISTSGRYSIFNIKKTFVTASAFYNTAKEHKLFGISLDRPFYSPLAKWAGGISYIKNDSFYKQTIIESNLINSYTIHFNNFDVWGAKSFPLTENKSSSIDRRSSNFIVGARYNRLDYTERPSFDIDSNLINTDEILYLTNYGFSKRKYYRDRYLFRYGANEDIPEGLSIELITGAMKKELAPLLYYSGIKMGAGQHINNFGYLSGGIAYGTFYNQQVVKAGVVNFDAFYFSDLIKKQRWYFRQFTRFKLIEGIDRNSSENLSINGNQMYGFSSSTLLAKSKMVLNFEFVMYAPYKVLGFQFAPVIFCGFAGLGNNFGDMFNHTFYQAYAIGVLIRNEYLVTNTFQLSIGLYPFMPNSPDFTIKGNPIGNYDVKARDYFISKPDLVSYQ